MSGPTPQPQPGPNPAIAEFNLKVAGLVKDLDASDVTELLSGRASSLLAADDNQNQNQNA